MNPEEFQNNVILQLVRLPERLCKWTRRVSQQEEKYSEWIQAGALQVGSQLHHFGGIVPTTVQPYRP